MNSKWLKYGAVAFAAWMAWRAYQTVKAIETSPGALRRIDDYR